MGGLLNGKVCECTIISNMSSCIANIILSGQVEMGIMSPSTTKVALDSETSCGRVTQGGDIAVRANVVRAVLSIVISTMTSKAFS
jgi:hypothetical protein